MALGHRASGNGATPLRGNRAEGALQIDPRSVAALDHLAQVLTAEKRFSAAIRYLKQAIELDAKRSESSDCAGRRLLGERQCYGRD